jgi:DNA-damage-inducible protein J
MAQVNINFRMDADLKKEMENACKDMGMSLTTAFTIYAKKVSMERRIPFEITADPVLNSGTLKAINETEQIITEYNNGIRKPKSYSNASEMFSAMDIEDALEVAECSNKYV